MKYYIAIGYLIVNVGLRFKGLLPGSASDPRPHFKVEKHSASKVLQDNLNKSGIESVNTRYHLKIL